MPPEKFLHSKDNTLQRSEAVSAAVEKQDRLNLARKQEILESADPEQISELQEELECLRKTPNTPEARVDAYLKRLENVFLNEDIQKRARNVELLKPYIYDEFTIKEANIPESYWNLQRKVAREEGRDFPEIISEAQHSEAFEKISQDQKHSLDRWIDYLTGPDALYPTWFKFFAIKSVLGLAEYDKKEHTFPKRTKSTTGLYPDLNAEALSYVCEFLEKQLRKEKIENPIPEPANPHAQEVKPVSDEEFEKIISSENFAKYYGFTLEHMTSQKELWPETRGEWRTFEQGQEAELVKSLQGKGTGWCTAGAGMAGNQLSKGSFHVYYSLDKLGQPTVPRLAIRMDGGSIAEVRGVEADQNIDSFISPVIEEKLPEFGEQGKRYLKQNADMKRLTEIDAKSKSEEMLTPEELRFLYELDDKITSFRQHGKDPRIQEIKSQRGWLKDMQEVYASNSHEELAQKLIADRKSALLLEHLDVFSGLTTDTALSFIQTGAGYSVLRNWDSFSDLNQKTIVEALIKQNNDIEVIRNLDKFTALTQQEIVDKIFELRSGTVVAEKLDAFTEIDPKSIYDRLLKEKKFEGIAQNINKFTELNPEEIAMDLSKAGSIDVVLRYYENFGALDDQYFAEYAVVTGKTKDLADNLGKLTTIEGEAVADKLLSQGFGDSVARNIDIFIDLDKQDVVDKLVVLGHIRGVLDNIKNFPEVSLDTQEVGDVFIQNLNEKNPSLRNVGMFPKEFQLQCTQILINKGKTDVVAKEIKELNKEIHKDVSLQILNHFESAPDSEMWKFASAFEKFNNFSEIDSAVAFKLLTLNESSIVFECIEKYTDLNHQELVDKIDLASIDNLHKLRNLNQETFIGLLTTPARDSGGKGVNFDYIIRNIGSFTITDHQLIADKLIELGQSWVLTNNLDKFNNLSPETAKELFPVNSYLVARHLDKFPGVNQQEIADELIVLNQVSSIAQNLNNFPEISQETLEKIITTETHRDVAKGLQYLNMRQFDQDSLAAKFLEIEDNVYFSALRQLRKYQSLTKEQLDVLQKTPKDLRAVIAKKMVDDGPSV